MKESTRLMVAAFEMMLGIDATTATVEMYDDGSRDLGISGDILAIGKYFA